MIDENQIIWMKEFLLNLSQSESDSAEIEGIVNDYRGLLKVYRAAESLVNKAEIVYAPNSRKANLKAAVDAMKPGAK